MSEGELGLASWERKLINILTAKVPRTVDSPTCTPGQSECAHWGQVAHPAPDHFACMSPPHCVVGGATPLGDA
jgi:hypothetical protein